MRSFNALVFLLCSVPSVLADVKFSSPAAGAAVPGGTAFTVTWIDSGIAPSIADLTTYTLFLYSGSNAAPQQLATLSSAVAFTAGSSVTITVPPATGGGTVNAYFLGMISTAAAGGTVTNYSNRFTLQGMTGVFPPAVITALQSVAGTTGPPTVNAVAAAAAPPAAGAVPAGAAGDFAVPYQMQSGPMRYAAMQPVPGTKITATNTEPLFPTSAVIFATTFLPIPTVISTQTMAQTFKASSHPNTAAAASQPTGDMAKFLNRWKD